MQVANAFYESATMQICMLLVDALDVEFVESIIMAWHMCAVWTLTCVYMVLFLTPMCMHAYMVVKSEGLSFLLFALYLCLCGIGIRAVALEEWH